MDVVDGGQNGHFGPEVSVVPTPLLPKPKTMHTGPLADGQLEQQRAFGLLESSFDTRRERALECLL